MMKRLSTTVILLLFTLSIFPISAFAQDTIPFYDSDDHWAKDSIVWGYENKLINGVSEDTFSPNGTMNRAMAVTILYRYNQTLDSELASSNEKDDFDDVPVNSYFYDAVKWGQQNGIINGTSKTTFKPYRLITRQEFMTMLCRYNNTILDIDGGFVDFSYPSGFYVSDREDIDRYAVPSVTWAYFNGIILGTENKTMPRKLNTRAEAITMLSRYHQYRVTNEPLFALSCEDIEYIKIDRHVKSLTFSSREDISDIVDMLNHTTYRGKQKSRYMPNVYTMYIHFNNGTVTEITFERTNSLFVNETQYYLVDPYYFTEWLPTVLDDYY